MINKHLVLIAGKSATGKTASLRTLKNPEGVLYMCCESGKELPFPSKFLVMNVTDPLSVFKAFEKAEQTKEIHTIVLDSLDYLMAMFESTYVLTSSNTMKAWSNYGEYFRNLHQKVIAECSKNVIVIAHTSDAYREQDMLYETGVHIKGSVEKQGVESFYNLVIACKKLGLKDISEYSNDMLHITEEDEICQIKYVYQTRLTRDTVNEKIRGPIGLFSQQETYVDNDAQALLDRLHEYYK
jgi:hypothetical protein